MTTQNDPGQQLATVADVAERLAVHPETVRRYARQGILRGHHLPGGLWRFDPADVDRFARGLRSEAHS